MLKINIYIDKNSKEKLYFQIYNCLKKQILSGDIKVGMKLPSIRQVAIKLNINQNTVIQSYNLLEEKGLIKKISGKGCFVQEFCEFKIEEKEIPLIESFKYGQFLKSEKINFSNGTPCSEYFPIKEYQIFFNDIIKEYGGEIFEYQSVQGVDSLRYLLSEEFEKEDIFVKKENLQITSGTQQALDIIIKLFSKETKPTVALSDPTYPNALNIFKGWCNIKTLDIKKDGWDLDEFEEILKEEKIDFIYECINFQNPTGVMWSLEKRKKLLKLSEKYNFYIVEDDSFSDFYYYGEKPKSLKSLDKIGKEKVIYIKTYSKILMPGIGLAVMAIPENLIQRVLLIKYGLDTTTSGINQKILEKFIITNKLSHHLEKLRYEFGKKQKLCLTLLEKMKNLQVMHKPTGGFFIWIKLSDEIDGEKFYLKCKSEGVALLPGTLFYKDKRDVCKIRLSFISPTLEEIKIGLEILEKMLFFCMMENSKKSSY
ncbi:PLP-dependent aminotransferase family protein [Cetobacterium somerae]|uniref:aminotransferase-like domain-containing protein n=1 Tax=Cetobacterium sp. NK01 TaxID=2993530 RepID=UPI002115DA37|nr:PLP-dependent aminotransferase family protein [Cetobacterium sp. NK01]MCQ8213037.1 PLP-dependent aminotransferase family protein [Cetobacterium sp. NK01]